MNQVNNTSPKLADELQNSSKESEKSKNSSVSLTKRIEQTGVFIMGIGGFHHFARTGFPQYNNLVRKGPTGISIAIAGVLLCTINTFANSVFNEHPAGNNNNL